MTDWSSPRSASWSGRRTTTLRDRVLDRESPLRRTDWVLNAAVLSMCVFGALLVWAATRPMLLQRGGDPQAFLKKHILNLAIGIVLATVTTLVDYRILRAYAPVIYVASCIGLIAVLSPLGSTVNGAHSWIQLGGGFELQPAEFAKVALAVGLAMFLGEKRDGESAPRDTDVMLVLGLAAVPLGLIMLQPDLGTAVVFVFMIMAALAVSGAPSRWLVGLVLCGVLGGVAVAQLGLLKGYQADRIHAFVDPTADTRSAGYNTAQARIAIGSGGVFGKGLFNGSQTNGHFVPEQQTDFVFTVAGEEFGFVGSGLLIGMFGVVLWRGLRIAARADDLFGTLVAASVVAWFAFQGFENIGMCLGIMPVTGLPLPFVSYGGSSMFANMIAIGLLQNVHQHAAA